MTPSRLLSLLSSLAAAPLVHHQFAFSVQPSVTSAEFKDLLALRLVSRHPVSDMVSLTAEGHARLLSLQESARSAATQEFAAVHIGNLSAQLQSVTDELDRIRQEFADYKSQQEKQRKGDIAQIDQVRRKSFRNQVIISIIAGVVSILANYASHWLGIL